MQMKDACWWGTKNSNQRRIKAVAAVYDRRISALIERRYNNQGVGAGTGITILFGGGGGRIR